MIDICLTKQLELQPLHRTNCVEIMRIATLDRGIIILTFITVIVEWSLVIYLFSYKGNSYTY